MPRRAAFLSLALACLCGPLAAQAPTAADFERAHGAGLQRLDQCEVRGTVQTPSGTLPFVLKISGDRSRLLRGDVTIVRQGVFFQWRRGGGPWSDVRRDWEGLRDSRLVAPLEAAGLSSLYTPEGSSAGRSAFRRTIPRHENIAYRQGDPTVRLVFDDRSRLLAEALHSTEDGRLSEVALSYSEYRRFGSAAVAARVERRVGGGPPWVFLIESVDWSPDLKDSDFSFQTERGAP